ncbi:MAG: MopE-related protein [Pseudomonadota bacterium]|nr:MopE-related protein [Pseudomonadota bacterium]
MSAVLPLLLAMACDSGKVVVDDTGPVGEDTDTSLVDGALSVSPSALDFGIVFVGQAVDPGVVTVQNVGDGPIDLGAVIEGDPSFTLTLPGTSPEPGLSADIAVTFTPTAFGPYSAELVVTDALGEARVVVPLTGTAQVDDDSDGVGSVESGGLDCDDANASAHPGATEVWYNGVDEDCAGGDDFDQDADGFVIGVDCDDTTAEVFPGAPDAWYDGVDADCAGDDDQDQDADGYAVDLDCDDTNATTNPDADETWYDDVDQDCSGGSDWDQDGDGVDSPTDCNDTDATVTGPVAETRNGVDDDCDGLVDDLSVDEVVDGVLYGATASLGLGDSDGLSLGGDLTGDGADDLVVTSDASSSGYAWVVSGATAATANGTVDTYDTADVTGGSSYYPMGNIVGPARDLTGDGTSDLLLAGAGSTSSSYSSNGYGWLVTGGASLSSSFSTATTYTARFTGDSSSGDALAWVVSGDIDGDGHDDVVAGCVRDDFTSSSWGGDDSDAGNVAVYAGASFSGSYDMTDSDDQIHGAGEYDYLGSSLVVADLDGDGYDDIVAGAYGVDDGASNAGAIYLFKGNSTLEWDERADDAYDAILLGSGANHYVGYYPLTAPGDVDGDGSLDLSFATLAGGEAYLWWGAGTLSGSASVTGADVVITGTAGSFGSALAYASDLDGDGADELYVGDSGNDTVGSDAGAVFEFAPTGAASAWTTANASATYWGVATGDGVGSGLAGGGDADGDGTDDLLIGATGADGGASDGGAVYIVLGG